MKTLKLGQRWIFLNYAVLEVIEIIEPQNGNFQVVQDLKNIWRTGSCHRLYIGDYDMVYLHGQDKTS